MHATQPDVAKVPVVRVGMIGLGTVGTGVAHLLAQHAEMYARRFGVRPELTQILVRDTAKARPSTLPKSAKLTHDIEAFVQGEYDAVIEVAGGSGPILNAVRTLLEQGTPVVTANKAMLAEHGHELFGLARQHGTSLAFEASCGGGIPCITALTQGLMANRISGLYGILNGTCNFILTQMNQGLTYAQALKQAQELGYAEADPSFDVQGIDAGQKLAILASLAFGVDARGSQVACTGIDNLDAYDVAAGKELGYDIKLLAIAEKTDPTDETADLAMNVEPCFLHDDEILADIEGPFNAVVIAGDAAGTILLSGQGAGQLPTASAVVADLLNTLTGTAAYAMNHASLTPDRSEPVRVLPAEALTSRFYIRINAHDRPGTMGRLTTTLGHHAISLSAVTQHEPKSAQADHVPVVLLTQPARRGNVIAAVNDIAESDITDTRPTVLRIVDLP